MWKRPLACLALVLLVVCLTAAAGAVGGPPGFAASPIAAAAEEPEDGPAILAALAGEYDLVSRFWPTPGSEVRVSRLPATRRLVLDGRVVHLEVGPDAGDFLGTGLAGYDRLRRRFWYTWADTSTTGVSILFGTLTADGDGSFSGETPTPYGYSPLRIEIRRQGAAEIHDYYVPAEDGGSHRFLELTYTPRGQR